MSRRLKPLDILEGDQRRAAAPSAHASLSASAAESTDSAKRALRKFRGMGDASSEKVMLYAGLLAGLPRSQTACACRNASASFPLASRWRAAAAILPDESKPLQVANRALQQHGQPSTSVKSHCAHPAH